MSDIKDIFTFTLSKKDECCKTFKKTIDFLTNELPQRGGSLYYTGNSFNLKGRSIVLFKREGKLIAKGIISKIVPIENSAKYSGYYLVEENSIEIFKKQISLNDLNKYVSDISNLTRDRRIDINNLENINKMIKDFTSDNIDIEHYNIWSMNVSKKENYDEAWELFKQNSCISIDYWINNKTIDYSSFKNVSEIKGHLKDSIHEGSREPNLINCFVNDIKKGDIFIVHKGQTVVCGIGIVDSDYIYQNDKLTNIRKINWIYSPDNLKIKDKYLFKTDNIVKLNEKYSYFVNEILARIAGKDKFVRDSLLDFIFNEYFHDFHSTLVGQNHFNRYEIGKEKIANDWKIINDKIESNEDFSDDFWKNLFHRDLELFSIGGNDLKGMIQSKSKIKNYNFTDEDMDNLAREFVKTTNNLLDTDDIDEQKRILNEYKNDIYKSYGFQTGIMSPILFYLNEKSFYPINSKAIKTVRLMSLMLGEEVKLSSDLIEYADSNERYKKFFIELKEIFNFDKIDNFGIRVFDEFCHWICDGKLGNYADNEKKVVKIFPIKKILMSIMNKKHFKSEKKRNLIYFGAPGTGKSYNLNKDKDNLLKDFSKNYERVTFHPDYSYANFVGTYKPVPEENSFTYKYVPGPFMRILKKALEKPSEPFLLIIEEINRANVAATFGDVFQLLDRDKDNKSEYPIDASEEAKAYINIDKIKLPSNLFIWCTMNSADQGVFMMDTAFKRRWDFKYFSINHNENLIDETSVNLNNINVNWNTLRKGINDELLSYKINEDKCLGPFFAFNEYMNQEIPEDTFKDIFKSKIIMYLFEDAARSKRNDLFSGAKTDNYVTYSQICETFDEKGIEIFCDSIKSKFISDDE
ncbi:AAA family ATPase [Methanobrevibacter sp.]|uniref:AAA family ATPase n=1 Tax=Methanobrevibacter sp. TaxID=66852 RepID=UPI00386A941C